MSRYMGVDPSSAVTAGSLVEVDWLLNHLGEPDLVVVDCRFRLGDPGAGEREYLDGHLPGAAFLDVDRDLSAEPGDRGRHPLPDPSDFEAAARRAGIGRHSFVVVYDEAGEGGAVRLWWLLRHFGHDRVAVLNGGLRGWRAAGGPLRAGAEAIDEADFAAHVRARDTVTADELLHEANEPAADATAAGAAGLDETTAEPTGTGATGAEEIAAEATAARAAGHGPVARTRLLLDARAPERYRGEVEPIDSVAGHIPRAVNLPFTELVPEGRFLPADELRARLEAIGAAPDRELVAYCGSGITACTLLLAAEVAGLPPARLYPGSWSEWSRRGYPVARQESARSTESRSSGPGGVRSR